MKTSLSVSSATDDIKQAYRFSLAEWSGITDKPAIFLLGYGNVGKAWHQQWLSHSSRAKSQLALIADSRTIQILDRGRVLDSIDNKDDVLVQLLVRSTSPHKIIIDATPSEAIANQYKPFIEAGAHIISANKITSASTFKNFSNVEKLAEKNNRSWYQNATVGAGLPVHYSIKNLLDCGDDIVEIKGVFSGTLSWLLQTYDGTQPLSLLIKQAQSLGFTESDPRLDLAGGDVARKLLILARLIGHKLELDDISVEPVIEQANISKPIETFWQNAVHFDKAFDDLWQKAHAQQKTLTYKASIKQNGEAHCAIVSIDKKDPLATITPCDNIFVISSKWYADNPLIIRGPGAGREVTAAAVQSDLNRILNNLS